MKNLPDNLEAYKRTPEFDENSVPKGLLKAHQTKQGVWGKLSYWKVSCNTALIHPIMKY